MINLNQFGKGAVRTPETMKANQFKLAEPVLPAINWGKPRRPRYLPILDQKSSSSCTAQATVYYGKNLLHKKTNKLEDYSRRHIYSQIWLPPDGGAYIWAALSIPLKQGYVLASSVPDGDSLEETMRDQSENSSAMVEAMPAKYAQLTNTKVMDYLAYIIDKHGGFETGFNGNNLMFDPNGVTNIPTSNDWGHAVYVYDYGLLPDGRKTLIYPNSWSDQWGDGGYGYFPETFVKSGYMFDLYTYAAIEDIDPISMNNRFVTVLNGNGDVWLVKNGVKYLVYNALAFNIISGEWNKIEKITQAQLDLIPDSGQVVAGLSQQ